MARTPNDDFNEERYSADKLLTSFSKTRMSYYITLAVAIHVVVLVGTSYTYIRKRIDPEWAEQQRKAEKAKRDAEELADPELVTGKAAAEKAQADFLLSFSNQLASQLLARAMASNAVPIVTTNISADGTITNVLTNMVVLTERQKLAMKFQQHNIDTNNPDVWRVLETVPKDRWFTEPVLELIRAPKKGEIPTEPGAGIGLGLEDTN